MPRYNRANREWPSHCRCITFDIDIIAGEGDRENVIRMARRRIFGFGAESSWAVHAGFGVLCLAFATAMGETTLRNVEGSHLEMIHVGFSTNMQSIQRQLADS